MSHQNPSALLSELSDHIAMSQVISVRDNQYIHTLKILRRNLGDHLKLVIVSFLESFDNRFRPVSSLIVQNSDQGRLGRNSRNQKTGDQNGLQEKILAG